MTKQTLAAVAAAAADGASAPAPAKQKTESPAAPPAPPAVATAPKQEAAAAPDIEKIRREGATAERERLLALDVLALPGCEAIVEKAKEDGTPPAECALSMVRHIKANRLLDISASMAKGAATVPALESAPEDPVGGSQASSAPKPGTEAAWKASYQGSATLQAEFRSEADYLAYQKARATGRARIRGQKEG